MEIPVQVKRNPRAKRMSITVRPDGSVTVTQPRYASRFMVNLFVRSRRKWIEEKVAYFREHPNAISTEPNVDGSLTPKARLTRRDYLKHKEAARALVNARLIALNAHYGFVYNSVSIKNLRSRWGSCSAKKNLNFNYKILFLAQEEQDYIIVHELCHLAQMNHGPKFWALVSQMAPDYKAIRRKTRKLNL